jgi:hypothetical protein
MPPEEEGLQIWPDPQHAVRPLPSVQACAPGAQQIRAGPFDDGVHDWPLGQQNCAPDESVQTWLWGQHVPLMQVSLPPQQKFAPELSVQTALFGQQAPLMHCPPEQQVRVPELSVQTGAPVGQHVTPTQVPELEGQHTAAEVPAAHTVAP